jgi:hypothetical protein
MTFKKKSEIVSSAPQSNEGAKSPRGYVDASKYAKISSNVVGAALELEELAKSLQAGAAEVGLIEESRRQEAATYAFNLKLRRDAELSEFSKEDASREAAFALREAALADSEGELCSLLGLQPNGELAPTAKQIRTAYEAKIKQAEDGGEKRGFSTATNNAKQAQTLAEAQAATAGKLLEQENAQLKKANTALELQVKELLAGQGKVIDQISQVAKGAFDAAGGVTSKANDALGVAAAGAATRGR